MVEKMQMKYANNVCGCCNLHQVLDNTLHPGGLKLTERLAEVTLFKPGLKILEIGCGRGITAIFLARNYGCSVTGIDTSPALISSARDRAECEGMVGKTSFVIADAQELPILSHSFDVVVCECSLSLIPDKERAVNEIRRVLKSGGKLTITDLINRVDEGESEFARTAPSPENSIAFFPCIENAESIEVYLERFERAGFQNLYVEDCSQTLKEALFRMRLRFGGKDKLVQEIPCSCDGYGDEIPVRECQNFGRKSYVGYALIAATKQEG